MAWNPNIPTVTNRVQDDLNAIRENFRHLDPLAPYIQAILGSRIVEMGSNANGEYVRWENGLQVCWHRFYQNRPTTTATGSLYRDNDATTWTFPAAFITSPAVYGAVLRDNDDGFRFFFAPNSVTTTSVTYRDVATGQGPSLGRRDQLLAIGRWK